MNKHILLVMKWLNNQDSVSQKELEKNRRDACAAATNANLVAAHNAAAAAASYAAYAGIWVNKYFETTGEDRAQYEKELEK